MVDTIILVVADDVGWGDLATAQTPRIAEMREQGTTLAGYHSMPSCSPSRTAMLHGAWPRRFGVGEEIDGNAPPSKANRTPPRDRLTLPRLLKAAGFSSALVGKWHLGQSGLAFSAAHEALGPLMAGGYDRWLAGSVGNLGASGGYSSWSRVDDGVVSNSTQYATEAQVEAAVAWLGATAGSRFLTVALNAAHAPFHTPPAVWRYTALGPLPTQEQRRLAMVESVDIALGTLRAAAPGALVLFVSDNGTPGAGKGTTLQAGVNVPAVIAGPGISVNHSTTALVSCADVFAVLAFHAGIDVPAAWGQDSLRIGQRLRLLSERFDSGAGGVSGDDVMVRDARWKLRALNGATTLYDLQTDPLEQSPLQPPLPGPEHDAAWADLSAYLASLPGRG